MHEITLQKMMCSKDFHNTEQTEIIKEWLNLYFSLFQKLIECIWNLEIGKRTSLLINWLFSELVFGQIGIGWI